MTAVIDTMTDVTLATDAVWGESFWSHFRGWMLRGAPRAGEGLILQPCSSIHMMFMRFAIDAVFFDREGRVTHVSRRVRPWIGLSFGRRGAHGVVELPVGAAAGVERGHQLSFVERT